MIDLDYKIKWLVIRTNRNRNPYTQEVKATSEDEAFAEAEDNFEWDQHSDPLFSSCSEIFNSLLYDYECYQDYDNSVPLQAFPDPKMERWEV